MTLVSRALELGLRASSRRAGLVLVYHSLAERDGDPGRELVPAHAVALFEAQLRYLGSRYRVVRAGEILEAVTTRQRGDAFPVAVTLDDDLRSHRTAALPVLKRMGVPATFFLTGAALERPVAFWWEQLQEASERGIDVGGSVHEVAARVEAMPPDERDAFAARFTARLDPPPAEAGLRADDVRALAAAGHDIGFHTLEHHRLTHLDAAVLGAAMRKGRRELEELLGRPLDMIGYPHGKADERVARAANDAGFRLGFTGRYAPIQADDPPLMLGRIEPTRGSVSRFALQLAKALHGPHR